MSLKTSFNEIAIYQKEFDIFPAIGRGKGTSIFVLFIGPGIGTIISTSTGKQIGDFSKYWDMSKFTEIFEGELTFKKEQQ